MLYLVTGANGAGKTLNTLKWVREKQLKESRPVAYNGRFDMKADFGWIKIDAKDWQDQPDGTIFLFDECHNDFPVRGSSAPVPDQVRMLGEHRRRGFDFFLITQHPQNLDMFIRRLIGPPGWHRHLKRNFGADLVSVLEWGAVNASCEKEGSGKSGTVTMQAFPKEVYDWYNSATLHTGKKRIPLKIWVLIACLILIPAMVYWAVTSVGKNATRHIAAPQGAASGVQQQQQGRPPGPLTAAEYVQQLAPRINGLAYTAPRYDEVTKPTTAPYPAACIASAKSCQCYTQQGTKLVVPPELCQDIVRTGYFMDWNPDGGAAGTPDKRQQAQQQPAAPAPATQQQPAFKGVPPIEPPHPAVVSDAGTDDDQHTGEIIRRMRHRSPS